MKLGLVSLCWVVKDFETVVTKEISQYSHEEGEEITWTVGWPRYECTSLLNYATVFKRCLFGISASVMSGVYTRFSSVFRFEWFCLSIWLSPTFPDQLNPLLPSGLYFITNLEVLLFSVLPLCAYNLFFSLSVLHQCNWLFLPLNFVYWKQK